MSYIVAVAALLHQQNKKWKVGRLCHCAILRIKENENRKDFVWGPVSTWRINSETAELQNRIRDHEINNDTTFSVSSSMSSYSASSILLVLPRVPFCYTLVGQITFSQELRWGQNKSIRTHCSEWDKRVLTIDTNRNNLRHETKEWKKYRSYLLVTNAGSNLRPDFTIRSSHI